MYLSLIITKKKYQTLINLTVISNHLVAHMVLIHQLAYDVSYLRSSVAVYVNEVVLVILNLALIFYHHTIRE